MRPLLCVLALSIAGCAKQPPSSSEAPIAREAPATTIEAQLHSTELVMAHQAALELSEAQESAIRGELQRAQAELVDAEWALAGEREQLSALLANEQIDEPAALEVADRVLEREAAIKRIHLRLLIRIHNQLTPAQRAELDALRP